MEPKTLTEILGSASKSSLFSGTPFKVAKPVQEVVEVKIEEKKETKKEKELEISKNEEKKVVFVGNVDLGCKKKHVKRLMEPFGTVQKVWRRSIPLDRGKLPIVAAVALKKVLFT